MIKYFTNSKRNAVYEYIGDSEKRKIYKVLYDEEYPAVVAMDLPLNDIKDLTTEEYVLFKLKGHL